VITEQTIEVECLRHEHRDASQAEQSLRSFEHGLQTVREHRDLIIKMIELIDAGLA